MRFFPLLAPFGGGSSVIDPLSLGNLALWLNANDLTTLFQDSFGTVPVTADNDPVGAWLDKSGNARHVSQSTAGLRPSYQTGALNGKPGIQLDGVDDLLLFVSTLSAAIMNESTVYVVLSGWAKGGVQGLLAGSGATADPYYLRIFSDDKPEILQGYVGGNVTGTNAMDNAGVILVAQHSDAGNSYLFQSGHTANGSGASANTFTAATAQLGAQTGGLNEYYTGLKHEILVYNAIHSASTITSVVNYLRSTWGAL